MYKKGEELVLDWCRGGEGMPGTWGDIEACTKPTKMISKAVNATLHDHDHMYSSGH